MGLTELRRRSRRLELQDSRTTGRRREDMTNGAGVHWKSTADFIGNQRAISSDDIHPGRQRRYLSWQKTAEKKIWFPPWRSGGWIWACVRAKNPKKIFGAPRLLDFVNDGIRVSGFRCLVNRILSQGHIYGVNVEGMRYIGKISGCLELCRRPSGAMFVFLEFGKKSDGQNGHSWIRKNKPIDSLMTGVNPREDFSVDYSLSTNRPSGSKCHLGVDKMYVPFVVIS